MVVVLRVGRGREVGHALRNEETDGESMVRTPDQVAQPSERNFGRAGRQRVLPREARSGAVNRESRASVAGRSPTIATDGSTAPISDA